MFRLQKLTAADQKFMFDVMKQNMLRYHELYSIPWDQEWLERNYLDKENFIVLIGEDRAGIISLECLEDKLHVHTLQLASRFQNRRIGLYILRELARMMRQNSIQCLSCKVFKDNPARRMYEKMGFMGTSEEGVFLSMEARLDSELMRYAARSSTF